MDQVQFKLNEKGEGAFYISEGSSVLGEMVISINGNDLTVYHTEVVREAEGKGLAKNMLDVMVNYAREHHKKVIPLCPYVHLQFRRHPEEYKDIWKKSLV